MQYCNTKHLLSKEVVEISQMSVLIRYIFTVYTLEVSAKKEVSQCQWFRYGIWNSNCLNKLEILCKVLNKDRYLLFLQRIQDTANSEIKVLMAEIIVLVVRKKR